MEKERILRHEPGDFTHADLEGWNRDWRAWQNIGSALYHSAVRAAQGPLVEDDSWKLLYGMPEARITGSHDWVQSQFDRVGGMLFGMALEAWLKGLCVRDQPNRELKPLFTHDLRELARLAKIDTKLNEADRDLLELCHSLIEGFGRFAAPREADKVIPWTALDSESGKMVRIACDINRWNPLRQAVFDRFLELESSGK